MSEATNPAALYLEVGLRSPSSRRPQANGLRFIARVIADDQQADPLTLDWSVVTIEDAARVYRALCDHYQPCTARSYFGAYKKVIRYAWAQRMFDADTRDRLTFFDPITGTADPSGRALDLADLEKMLATCEADDIGRRDRAALALLFGAGLRRGELAALALDQVDLRPEREAVKPHGKGRKDRVIPLPPDAVAELQPWLDLRGLTEPGPFLGHWLRGRLRPIQPQAVYAIVKRRGKLAGVEPLPTPHDLRRGYATELARAGVDLLRISELMGHSNPATTARYIRQSLDEHRAAASRLRFGAGRGRSPMPGHRPS